MNVDNRLKHLAKGFTLIRGIPNTRREGRGEKWSSLSSKEHNNKPFCLKEHNKETSTFHIDLLKNYKG